MDKKKRLKEVRKKKNSIHLVGKFLFELIGMNTITLGIIFPTVTVKLLNPGYISLGAAWAIVAPLLITTTVLPFYLVYKRINKSIDLEREEISLARNIMSERVNELSVKDKKVFLEAIKFSNDICGNLGTDLIDAIITEIENNIETESKDYNDSDIKPQVIAPIDRTYDEKLSNAYTKKLNK